MENRTQVIVVKDGVPKELHGLPTNVLEILEIAYDKEKVVGISRKTYRRILEVVNLRICDYYELLNEEETDRNFMYYRTMAFCEAFGIGYDESKLLVEALLWVDRSQAEKPNFSSRNINWKNLTSALSRFTETGNPYREMSLDYNEWARELFKSYNLRVGIVRFCKLFWSVINVKPTGLEMATA